MICRCQNPTKALRQWRCGYHHSLRDSRGGQRNVTGTGAQFTQNAVIDVVRQYTATEIKKIADSLQNVDPATGVSSNSVLSELVRGALHAMAGCGGSVAVG